MPQHLWCNRGDRDEPRERFVFAHLGFHLHHHFICHQQVVTVDALDIESFQKGGEGRYHLSVVEIHAGGAPGSASA